MLCEVEKTVGWVESGYGTLRTTSFYCVLGMILGCGATQSVKLHYSSNSSSPIYTSLVYLGVMKQASILIAIVTVIALRIDKYALLDIATRCPCTHEHALPTLLATTT